MEAVKRNRTVAPRVLEMMDGDGHYYVPTDSPEITNDIANAPSTAVAMNKVKKFVAAGLLNPGSYRLIYVSKEFRVSVGEEKKVVTRIE